MGSAGLVWLAPELARGNILDPRVIALSHVFTLGVVATSIFGALYQLFPAVLGVGARSTRVGHWSFVFLLIGTATLILGFATWSGPLLLAGWAGLFAAVGGVSWNLLPQRRRASRGRRIGWYVAAGHSALGTAMALGAVRIGDALGWWSVDRLGILAAHFHLAAYGFASLTAVGFGSHMLPMFLLSRGHAERPLGWILPVGLSGLVAFSVGAIWRMPALVSIGAAALLLAVCLHLFLAWSYAATRSRRALDPGVAHVVASYCFLALASAAGLLILATPGPAHPRQLAAYALLALLGWLTMLIVGIFYKILPFLTWLHRFSGRARRHDVPAVADLTGSTGAWSSLVFLTLGTVTLAWSTWSGSGQGARAGAVLFAAGTLLVVAQHARVLLARPAKAAG